MQFDESVYKNFYDYLNPDKAGAESWIEQGLVSDAPPEAVKAFEEFKAYIKRLRDMGVDC